MSVVHATIRVSRQNALAPRRLRVWSLSARNRVECIASGGASEPLRVAVEGGGDPPNDEKTTMTKTRCHVESSLIVMSSTATIEGKP